MSEYEELAFYTLAHGDPAFIHQHVVDAWMLQTADETTKPIGVTFALAGLFLHVEKHFTGRQVQLAHMKMAKRKREWPKFVLPAHRGSMTAADVLKTQPGPERDKAIYAWAAAVWDAYRSNRDALVGLLREYDLA